MWIYNRILSLLVVAVVPVLIFAIGPLSQVLLPSSQAINTRIFSSAEPTLAAAALSPSSARPFYQATATQLATAAFAATVVLPSGLVFGGTLF